MATANIFTDGDYSSPTPTGRIRVSHPLTELGDNEATVLEVDYIQDLSYFSPFNVALDQFLHNADVPELTSGTRQGYFPNAYLVNQSELTPVGSTLVQFTRTFATVPKHNSYGESYAWNRPGISSGAAVDYKTMTSITPLGTTTQVIISANSSPAISTGDLVLINFTALENSTGRRLAQNLVGVATVSGTTITLPVVIDSFVYGSLLPHYVVKITLRRDPQVVEVSSFVETDYFLPLFSTPGINTFADIPIIQPDVIVDSAGTQTNTFSTTTTPTAVQYLAECVAKKTRCVTASVVRRWMGNIYSRETRYVISQ